MVAKPKQKARVGVRIKETVGGKKSLNRSADLDQLTQRYNALQEKQKNLILALKTQHASICQMAKSRLMVADNLAIITKDSELYDCAGQMPTETLAKHEVCSYASIHHELATRTKMYADKYGQFVINYAIEWDKVVTQRVMTGLKEAEKLRRDLDHYQKKTESLRTGVNQTMAKGKQVDKKVEEKLGRNEEKLKTAREQYNKVATNMCVLIEEVTERAWKDIHPMLLKIAQFDYTLSSDETKALEALNTVQGKLRKLADEHQLKPENRLKDIQTLQASLLSTKKEEGLSIEADPNASGAFGGMDSMGGMAMPPGSVAPQGMGGFPVPIPSAYSGVSRASSVTSMSSMGTGYGSSTMNTSEMLAIAAAAAPPPTMDEVNDATNALTLSTAPNTGYSSYSSPSNGAYQRSGSLPPDFGQSNTAFGRSSSIASYGDADSSIASFSSAPAPAPSAPPPPPPSYYGGYPPAPAPMSMYGGAPAPISAPLPPSYGGFQQQHQSAPWTSGGQPQQSPSNQYGMPPQSPSNQYGNQYGMPPQSPSNQFGQQQPPNQFGSPPPLNNNGYGNYSYGNN
jgi:hypothetical protein